VLVETADRADLREVIGICDEERLVGVTVAEERARRQSAGECGLDGEQRGEQGECRAERDHAPFDGTVDIG